MESLHRIGIKGQAVDVHAIVVGKHLLKVGCLKVLATLAWQSGVPQLLSGGIAQRVEQSW